MLRMRSHGGEARGRRRLGEPGFFRGDGENSLRDRNLEKKNDRAIDRAYHSKQIDNDYKAATSKIPDQKANDPWAEIRPTPTAPAKK
jgi:hypothetical protein